MSDSGACCACLRVEWRTWPTGGPHLEMTGAWECKLCGSKFIPVRAADFERDSLKAALEAEKRLVASWQAEANRAREAVGELHKQKESELMDLRAKLNKTEAALERAREDIRDMCHASDANESFTIHDLRAALAAAQERVKELEADHTDSEKMLIDSVLKADVKIVGLQKKLTAAERRAVEATNREEALRQVNRALEAGTLALAKQLEEARARAPEEKDRNE